MCMPTAARVDENPALWSRRDSARTQNETPDEERKHSKVAMLLGPATALGKVGVSPLRYTMRLHWS